MSIFICPTCLTIANTATDYYWTEDQDEQESCTGCRPEGHQSNSGWPDKLHRNKETSIE